MIILSPEEAQKIYNKSLLIAKQQFAIQKANASSTQELNTLKSIINNTMEGRAKVIAG